MSAVKRSFNIKKTAPIAEKLDEDERTESPSIVEDDETITISKAEYNILINISKKYKQMLEKDMILKEARNVSSKKCREKKIAKQKAIEEELKTLKKTHSECVNCESEAEEEEADE